ARTYADWRAELRNRGLPVYALRAGASVTIGNVRLTALGPDALCPQAPNCVSMLRLSDASQSFLVAGNASQREQHDMVFRGVTLRADTLIFGLTQGADPDFVHAVGARHEFSVAPISGATRLPAGRAEIWRVR
ncbi:MAG TPA: hypothetical protein VF221_06965, partial [Chloroflexota bacterium]